MDGTGFDKLARQLAMGRSRRSVLRGLVGGGAAMVAARAGSSLATTGNKVAICHWSADLGYYELILVSPNAVEAHRAHGDIISPDFTDEATCGNCNTTCGEDELCGEAGCEAVFTGCANAALTGIEGGNGVCVDDRLNVYVNGGLVAQAPNGCSAEVALGPVSNGDVIMVEVEDDIPPCSLEPYQLLCKDTGETQFLAGNFCRGPVDGCVQDGWTGFEVCHTASHIVALEG